MFNSTVLLKRVRQLYLETYPVRHTDLISTFLQMLDSSRQSYNALCQHIPRHLNVAVLSVRIFRMPIVIINSRDIPVLVCFVPSSDGLFMVRIVVLLSAVSNTQSNRYKNEDKYSL